MLKTDELSHAELVEVTGRKRVAAQAAQLAPDLQAASKLLQHGSLVTTRQSYRQGDKIRPVR